MHPRHPPCSPLLMFAKVFNDVSDNPWNHYNNPSLLFFFTLPAPIYIFEWHAWLVCLITENCATAQLRRSGLFCSVSVFYDQPSGSAVTKLINLRRWRNTFICWSKALKMLRQVMEKDLINVFLICSLAKTWVLLVIVWEWQTVMFVLMDEVLGTDNTVNFLFSKNGQRMRNTFFYFPQRRILCTWEQHEYFFMRMKEGRNREKWKWNWRALTVWGRAWESEFSFCRVH